MTIKATTNAPIALLCSMTPGTAQTIRMMCPTRAIPTATQIVVNLPRYVSAMYAPRSGVT
jgi:hypothetical protein